MAFFFTLSKARRQPDELHHLHPPSPSCRHDAENIPDAVVAVAVAVAAVVVVVALDS